MNCPVCNIPLVMADKQGVEIDYCQKCRGIWLDRGELDKIIERSFSTGFAPYSNDPGRHGHGHDDRHHSSDYYKHKKKKNFLSDMFDFD